MKAIIIIQNKLEVPDQVGKTVSEGLHRLGFNEVKDARIGKYIELEIEESDENVARRRLSRMCSSLLANPEVEDFKILHVES